MNLGDLRAMVGSIVDYDPDVTTYQDEVTEILNQLYLDFFSDKRWQFAQKTSKLLARADQTATDAAYDGTASDTNITTTAPFFDAWMENQVLDISGGNIVAPNNRVNKEVRIVRVLTTTSAHVEGGSFAAGATPDIATAVTIVAKNRYLDLPTDCVGLISVGVRDIKEETLPHSNVSRYLDEIYDLDLNQTGRPTDWVLHDDSTLVPPRLAPSLINGGANPTGAPVTGSYQACYTYVHNGRESGPSPISTAVTFNALDRIDIAGMLDSGTNSGLLKRVYIKGPESKAFYAMTNADVAETTKTLLDVILADDYVTNSPRLPEHDGYIHRIRLWPRQDTELDMQVRMLFRPKELIDDADTPEFPSAHHRYLVYRACEELFIKHNNLQHSEMYRRKADKELLKMGNRHLSEGATHWVKQSYQSTQRFFAPTPTLTTSG